MNEKSIHLKSTFISDMFIEKSKVILRDTKGVDYTYMLDSDAKKKMLREWYEKRFTSHKPMETTILRLTGENLVEKIV